MLALKPFTEDHGWSILNSQVTCASWVCHPPTRTHVRLLGPCFKTGRSEPFRQHRRQAARYALMHTTDIHNTCILNNSASRKHELETKATSSVLSGAGHRAGQPLAFDSQTTDAGLSNKRVHRERLSTCQTTLVRSASLLTISSTF